MDVDAECEHEKESQEKMDEKELDVENLKERIADVVQPNALDRILEELNLKPTEVETGNECDIVKSGEGNGISEGLSKPNVENENKMNIDVAHLENLIKPNVENVNESKLDNVHPSDVDKILQDCNKYLNECEEVLQGCSKYLEECDDSEIDCGDDETSKSHSNESNIPKSVELNGTCHVNGDGISNKPSKNKTRNDGRKGKKNNGNKNSKQSKKDKRLKSEDSVEHGANTNAAVKNKKVPVQIGDTKKSTNMENKIFLDKDDRKNANNDGKHNGEPLSQVIDTEAIKNQSEPDKESVKMKINLNQSDDSEEDGDGTAKLVPLCIQEEFDEEMEKVISDMKQLQRNKDGPYSIDDTKKDLNLNAKVKDTFCSVQEEKSDIDFSGDGVTAISVENENTVDANAKTGSAAKDLWQSDDVQMDNHINQDNSIPSQDATIGTIQTIPEGIIQPPDKKDQDKGGEGKSNAAVLKEKMSDLEEELASTKSALRSAHTLLAVQQTRSNNVIMSLKLELYKTQSALKQEKMKSHGQLSDVISHLTLLEGSLRKSQIKHRKEVRSKNETIMMHRMEVMKLREQNDQLLNAIKEICANGGMNGYMREKQTSHSEKKGNNGKLGMVKDKFLMKNRSSLELNNSNMEKLNLKNQRLYSSQEDLKNLHDDTFDQNSPGHEKASMFDRFRGNSTRGSKQGNKNHRKNLQNFFSDADQPRHEMNKSNSDSSQISDTSSGVFSMSDQDLTLRPSLAGLNGHNNQYDDDDDEDDDDDGRFFSFSSTHINTVIDEEEALGNSTLTHSGQMMSMGSMPMLAHTHDDPGQRLFSSKDRPHSLSSVDLISIQRQAERLTKFRENETISEMPNTPPPSPSYNNNKSDKAEMTPFQTFKTMFKRKGNKNKVNKKRSVSLSQTTNNEYSEALKKHFQKYDMH